MNHFSVLVGITGKHLSVSQITQCIGLAADQDSIESTIKRNGSKTTVRKRNASVWTLKAKRGRTIEARVRSLLSDLPSDFQSRLKKLPGAKGCISIAVRCFDDVATLRLSKRLILDITGRGLALEIKIFSPSESLLSARS